MTEDIPPLRTETSILYTEEHVKELNSKIVSLQKQLADCIESARNMSSSIDLDSAICMHWEEGKLSDKEAITLINSDHNRDDYKNRLQTYKEALQPFAWLAEVIPNECVEVTWHFPHKYPLSLGNGKTEYTRALNGEPFLKAKEVLENDSQSAFQPPKS